MTLIKSISGIYGTIGGRPGDTLNPLDIVKLTSAFAHYVHGRKMVVGRDGRMSGLMVRNIVVGTLMVLGYDVINISILIVFIVPQKSQKSQKFYASLVVRSLCQRHFLLFLSFLRDLNFTHDQ